MSINEPGLFGIKSSNRDFTNANSWGKNQFNSSFPAALCCYFSEKNLKANYFVIEKNNFKCSKISIEDVFGISPQDPSIYFAFETSHMPFQKYIKGSLPRTDLVIHNKDNGQCISSFEVKLTALPDNTTCTLNEKDYGSEIVVRPDTIVYLACSLANSAGDKLQDLMDKTIIIKDWSDQFSILDKIDKILHNLKKILYYIKEKQVSFLLQPIWKTEGKSSKLCHNCLDIFIWSDTAFTYFITEIASANTSGNKITRQIRTAIWLYKMLVDISKNGAFDPEKIIDNLSYNTKNDKAFASSGNITNKFMHCSNLEKPRIKKMKSKT